MDTEHQAGLRGYALAEALGVPVVVMEPVKGGSLAQLPDDACAPLLQLDPEATPASWALRWAASLPHVQVVLSGMGNMEQLEDNLRTFQSFRPLDQREREAVAETAERLRRRLKNGCTGCGYCMPCPAGVDIPAASRSGTGCPCTKTKRSPGGSGRGWTRRSGPACATAAANVSGAAPSISGSGPSWPR